MPNKSLDRDNEAIRARMDLTQILNPSDDADKSSDARDSGVDNGASGKNSVQQPTADKQSTQSVISEANYRRVFIYNIEEADEQDTVAKDEENDKAVEQHACKVAKGSNSGVTKAAPKQKSRKSRAAARKTKAAARKTKASARKTKGKGNMGEVGSDHEADGNDDGDQEEHLETNVGSSAQPPVAPLEELKPKHILAAPWQCALRFCNTGMTWYPRDNFEENGKKVPGFGRKQVSHWFGRNKKETINVHADVWHWVCRKHYQREKYERMKKKAKERIFEELGLIEHQLKRIEMWRPEAKFTIQLTKAMKTRLERYHAVCRRNGNNSEAATKQVRTEFQPTDPKKDRHEVENHFPFDLAEHFDSSYSTDCGSYIEIRAILEWTKVKNRAELLYHVPPFEFLPHEMADGEPETDPTTNFARWCAKVDGKPFEGVEDVQPSIEPAQPSIEFAQSNIEPVQQSIEPVQQGIEPAQRTDSARNPSLSKNIESTNVRPSSSSLSDSPSPRRVNSGRPLSSTKGAVRGSGRTAAAMANKSATASPHTPVHAEEASSGGSQASTGTPTPKAKKRSRLASEPDSDDDVFVARASKRARK